MATAQRERHVTSPGTAGGGSRQRVQAGALALAQPARFAVVGVLNSTIDAGTLNVLLWRWPTHSPSLLLVFNSIAFASGALNSFCLNKYWTFKRRRATSAAEVVRFAILTLLGIVCNDGVIWLAARFLHPLIASAFLWANLSKACAVVGTAIMSYFGMRLWVFASHPGRVAGGARR